MSVPDDESFFIYLFIPCGRSSCAAGQRPQNCDGIAVGSYKRKTDVRVFTGIRTYVFTVDSHCVSQYKSWVMTGERRFHGSSISDGEAGCSIFTACGTSHKFIYGNGIQKVFYLCDKFDCYFTCAVPVLGFFGKGKVWEKNYILSENKQQVEQTKEEIRLLGEKYEKQMKEKYVAQVKKDIALQCGVDESDCRIKMDDMKITLIRVRVKNADKMQKEWQNELAFRYGVEEEKIWIEEA